MQVLQGHSPFRQLANRTLVGLYVHQGLLHQNLQLILLFLLVSVFLMPFSPQYLVGFVPYLELSVVEKQSLVRLYLSIPNSDAVIYVGCGERGNEMAE
ncbi:H(+)-transporting two-sector ATPase [Trifolium repens]|nr:H(+)-transporting two-sector ATPase [Trifolium repens]